MSGLAGPNLAEAIEARRKDIEAHLLGHPPTGLTAAHLQDGVQEYLRRGGKCLRGVVCMLSAGLFGGREADAIPASAAIEVFHAWTLVHDDIVDRDNTRRGGPTLHRYFEKQARSGQDAAWYGLSLSLLCGDIEQAWATELLCGLETAPAVALGIVRNLASIAVPQLVEGEVQDIELSGMPFAEIRKEAILEMIDKKTAVLYRFSGRAGAWIGRGSCESHPDVERMERFLTDLGVAFQLRDDVLGVTSSQSKTGKDSDSDIREGKRTLIAALAYERATDEQRQLLDRVLGQASATDEEIRSVRDLFVELKAIEDVEAQARDLVDRALEEVRALPDRPERQLLEALALFLVQRES